MSGGRPRLRATYAKCGTPVVRLASRRPTRTASVPFTALTLCLIALGLVLGACGGTVSPPPSQLSIEQILAGVLATGGDAGTEAYVQQEGEILLEPAGSAGPESFAGEVHVVRGPTTTFGLPPTVTTQPPVTLAPGQVAAWSGGTPGLYGGSRNKLVCDKEAQLRFLEQNPDKAAAFCSALNSDPTLRWSGGNKVLPERLRAYFAELTPLLLTRDTRVTNHGFRGGLPTPRQSVLQAGQGVLVDAYGVPRVRCECGNPLNPPQPVKTPSTYSGPKWENFDPAAIIVVQQTTVIVDTFVIVGVESGEVIDRPSGSAGEADVPRETTTSSTTTTFTTTEVDLDGIKNGLYIGEVYTAAQPQVPVWEILESTVELEITDDGIAATVEYVQRYSPRHTETEVTCMATFRVTYFGQGLVTNPLSLVLEPVEHEIIALEGSDCGASVEEELLAFFATERTLAGSFSDGLFDGNIVGGPRGVRAAIAE